MQTINEIVRQRIRRLRLIRRVGVRELASRIGLPASSYASLENGGYRISLDNLFRILRVLEADILEIWPPDAMPIDAAGESCQLRRHQEFRLQELISLAGAEGGALFRREEGRCSVLMHQHLSDFLIDRLILYIEDNRAYDRGLWFRAERENQFYLLFLKGDRCPAYVGDLARHYLTLWTSVFSS